MPSDQRRRKAEVVPPSTTKILPKRKIWAPLANNLRVVHPQQKLQPQFRKSLFNPLLIDSSCTQTPTPYTIVGLFVVYSRSAHCTHLSRHEIGQCTRPSLAIDKDIELSTRIGKNILKSVALSTSRRLSFSPRVSQ